MATSNETSIEVLHVLFQQWREEHRRLDQSIAELNAWMTQKSLHQSPDFAEANSRLQKFEQRLREHFAKEHEIGLLLAETRGITTPEIEELRRQADKEHGILTARLNDLIVGLSADANPVPTWDSAVYEFGLLLDAIEQHEEQEANRVQWLMPSQNT
jgi:hypothetical protein